MNNDFTFTFQLCLIAVMEEKREKILLLNCYKKINRELILKYYLKLFINNITFY